MKVYSCPTEVEAPKVDYANYDRDTVMRQEEEHQAMLKAWQRKL